jgi:hypothetical protein
MFDERKLFRDLVPIVQYVFRVPQDLEWYAALPRLVGLLYSFWSTLVVAVAPSRKSMMALYNHMRRHLREAVIAKVSERSSWRETDCSELQLSKVSAH